METKLENQIATVENLKSIKDYYGQLTDFLVIEQNKNRGKELEVQYVKEIERFLNFWRNIFEDFHKMSQNELEMILAKNKQLTKEMKEILEKVTGFKAPPNKDVLSLLAIRKIAKKIQDIDAVKFLNFDYFKRKNKEVNEKWILERRKKLQLKIQQFDEKLQKEVKLFKNKMNKELSALQHKRQKQLLKLMTKYQKCKNMVSELNAKDTFELKKLKRYFLIRNDVPALTYSETDDNFLNNTHDSIFKASNVNEEQERLQKKIQIEDELDNVSQKTLDKNKNPSVQKSVNKSKIDKKKK